MINCLKVYFKIRKVRDRNLLQPQDRRGSGILKHTLRARSYSFAALFLLGFAISSIVASPIPTEDSGKIGFVVGQLLSREHYRRQPLNNTISQQFLKLYLDDLDYNHLMLLESDIQEFQKKYALILDDEILRGNVQPGFEIFDRYIQRVEERIVMIQKLLKEDFSFNHDESIVLDRRDAPWPKNAEEACSVWRQRIKYELLQEILNKKKLSEASDIVLKRYTRLLRTLHEEDSESVVQFYLSALAHAYDPHSDYLSSSELNNFTISMKLSLVGIGALLSSDDGYAKVIAIVPGSPADLDKRLKVNARITAVGQGDGPLVDVVDMKLSKAVEMIRGEKNTFVRLQVIPPDTSDSSTRVEIKLKRNEIKLTETEAKAKLIKLKDEYGKLHCLGYIELPAFYSDGNDGSNSKSTTRDISRLIKKLKSQKCEGLLLDLRRNGGGLLGEAISLTGLFIKKGPIVQIKDSWGRIHVLNDENSDMLYTEPLVVLVNRLSASASEILAAALQDYGRAVIVGEGSTFGKGTVQKVEELRHYIFVKNDHSLLEGALKVTTQKFYRVSGGSTQYRGVISDIQLPSVLDYLKINEAAFKNALPYDEVPRADYVPGNALASFLSVLRQRSKNRIMHDPEFNYIQEDIVRLKERLNGKSVSLNESKRIREKEIEAGRIKKRNTERASRKVSAPEIMEITLELLDAPSSHAPALTQKVIKAAKANFEENDDDLMSKDSSVDPEFNEGLNILSDLIELSPKSVNP